MRDYAELGRQRAQGRRGAVGGRAAGLGRAWALASSGGVTAALSVLLALVLALEASGGGTWGPVDDPQRVGPLMVRLLLSLLTVNLVAVAVARVEAWRRGEVGVSIELARPLQGRDGAGSVEGWAQALRDAGARGVRAVRARGVSVWAERGGLVAWASVVLLHVAGLALLWHHALSLDDAKPQTLTLTEGQPVEALTVPEPRAGVTRRQPLQVFQGYRFDIEGAEQLRALVGSLGTGGAVRVGEGAVVVLNRAGEGGDGVRVPINARGEATLYDGTTLRLKEAQNTLRPSGATLSVTLADGQLFVKRVGRGRMLEWPGGPGLSLMDVDADRGGQGAAVKLLPLGGGEAFWVYAQAPSLAARRLPQGVSLAVLEVHNGLALTFEVVPPQQGLLPALGVSLLLLGGALLLLRPATALTLRDEGDRITLEGDSINDAASLPVRLQALAALCAEAPPAADGSQPEGERA